MATERKSRGKPRPRKRPPSGRGGIAKAIAIKERHEKACEMYLAGYSYAEIAKKLGYANPSGAWKAVEGALQDIPVPAAEEMKRLLVTGFVQVWKANLPLASGAPNEDGVPTKAPDRDAAEVLVKVGARLEPLLGLAIKRLEVTGKDGAPLVPTDLSKLSDDELRALARGPGKD